LAGAAVTDDEIYDQFGPEEYLVSAACVAHVRPGSLLAFRVKDGTSALYAVITAHPLQRCTCDGSGTGITVMAVTGARHDMLLRERQLDHHILTLVKR
jgi:hypothetical protein